MNVQVIFEDNHLIAVNKPAGWLVHGDETGDKPLSEFVKEYIKVRYDKPGAVFLGVIHRLDRPVSGVVVFARTSKALKRMNQLFQERKIEKTYWAITDKRPDPLRGRLEHYIDKDRSRNVAHARNQPRSKDARFSVLDYELIGEIGSNYLLKINPHTGRPHQIRVQLARIGCPIHGDVKYGYGKSNPEGTITLHCRRLAFEHPVRKEPVEIIADLPADPMWDMFRHFHES